MEIEDYYFKKASLEILEKLSEESKSKIELQFNLPFVDKKAVSERVENALELGLIAKDSEGKYHLTADGQGLLQVLEPVKNKYISIREDYERLKAKANLKKGEMETLKIKIGSQVYEEISADYQENVATEIIENAMESQDVINAEELSKNLLPSLLSDIWSISEGKVASSVDDAFWQTGMRIWEKNLSEEEAQEIMEEGVPAPESIVDPMRVNESIYENRFWRNQFIENIINRLKEESKKAN